MGHISIKLFVLVADIKEEAHQDQALSPKILDKYP